MTSPPSQKTAPRKIRDVRLDFFRGLSMFIIFIAHVPGNTWFLFIPARFGFSSAAELFVFCSGLASSFAFGSLFLRRGFLEGSLRVGHRVWQVYWAHVGLFLTMTATSALGRQLTGIDYLARLGLQPFLADAGDGILAFMTLRFIPAFNDILPLYIVLLCMIPLVMALSRLSRWLVIASLVVMWGMTHFLWLNLPSGNTDDSGWYFSPFAWQLMFFAGFGFGMGWLPMPALRRGRLFSICLAFVIISVPLNFWAVVDHVAWVAAFREAILPPGNQMYLSPLRFFHFLALAYVVLVIIEPWRDVLSRAAPIIRVGQQSLATFLASTSLVWIAGMILDQIGRGFLAVTLVNLAGFAIIVAVAYLAAFFKAPPWSRSGSRDVSSDKEAPSTIAPPVVPRTITQT